MGNSFPELAKRRIAAGIRVNDMGAVALYACFGFFLYLPTLGVNNAKIVCGFNTIVAAWGAYHISKRWVNNWTPSLTAGAVYG
ncbi:MAG: hypothetical protein ACYTE1_07415, partial [Planctomycetota bacterium]